MPSLSSKLQTLSLDLNDSDNDAWSWELLIEYLNAGLCLAASLNPKRFATPIDVSLVPGAQQPTGCSFLTGIVGIVTPAGVKQVSRRPVDSSAAAAYAQTSISPAKYYPTSIQPSEDDRESFYVDPPAPVGVSMKVRIQCASPVTYTLADVNREMSLRQCAQYEIAREWAMYRALSSERESARGSEIALAHRATFFLLVGAVLNSEATGGEPAPTQPQRKTQA